VTQRDRSSGPLLALLSIGASVLWVWVAWSRVQIWQRLSTAEMDAFTYAGVPLLIAVVGALVSIVLVPLLVKHGRPRIAAVTALVSFLAACAMTWISGVAALG
jgi:hypothetical protein